MSKELDDLEAIRENLYLEGCLDVINEKRIADIKSALERLEAIDKLQEEIGCPLEVLVKMWKNHNYYALKPRGRTRARQMDFPIISYILKGNKGNKMPYKSNSFILGGTCYDYDCFDEKTREFDGWDVNLADYKKTWWLKEDRSE